MSHLSSLLVHLLRPLFKCVGLRVYHASELELHPNLGEAYRQYVFLTHA